jgi:hypothetical protein
MKYPDTYTVKVADSALALYPKDTVTINNSLTLHRRLGDLPAPPQAQTPAVPAPAAESVLHPRVARQEGLAQDQNHLLYGMAAAAGAHRGVQPRVCGQTESHYHVFIQLKLQKIKLSNYIKQCLQICLSLSRRLQHPCLRHL